MKNEYWMCIIGPANPDLYRGNGADWPLRQAVRDKFYDTFGQDDICASGWGINQERYELLRSLHQLSTLDLKRAINFVKNSNENN